MTNKIIKGEVMSASNRGPVRTRISLLAGSSLAAATIILAAGGVALSPTAAQAANECVPIGVDPSANGPTADTYACAGSYAATGITYSSAGALTVNSTGGMNVGTVGVNLTGNAADAVTFTATGALTGTAGPVLDVTSVSGPINITAAGVTGTNVNVTHGIQAVSTGGGAITVVTTGTTNVTSTGVGALQQAAIRAVSTGGNGAVSVNANGSVTGRLYAIQAQASGTGALTVTVGGAAFNAVGVDATVGVAAIDAVTGTGLLTVDVTAPANVFPDLVVNGGAGAAVRTNAGGDAVINVNRGQNLQASTATTGILNVTAAGETTVNNAGGIGTSGTIGFGASPTILAIRAAGGDFTLNNNFNLFGRLDFSALTGASTINNTATGGWTTSGTSNFGPGEGEIINDGTITIASSLVTFTGLESFNNTGAINFRGTGLRVLSMPGVAYSGSGIFSRLQMEAVLGTAGQASCAAVAVADCLDLSGGETSGVTNIVVTISGAVTSDANTDGIVLVDVSGGVSHAGDFVIDNTTANYSIDPVYGGVIITPGWLAFALQYDEAVQQHILSSVVPTQKLEYIAALQEMVSIWHSTSDTVAGRQADLRDRGEAGAWVRVTGENTTRDVDVSYTAGGVGYQHADEYEMKTATAIAGFDLIYASVGGGDLVVGFHGGAVRSSLERQSSSTTDEIDGAMAGVYGGWWSDGLTLDATLNANFLTLEHDRPVDEISTTNVMSTGVRAEAGWRLPMSEAFYVQPLASVAYVHAAIKEVVQTNFEASYEDVDSLRAALGARVGGDLDMGGSRLGYWVTGRVWKEFAGEGALVLTTPAEDVSIQDDLAGEFQEVGAGLSLSDSSDTLEGYVSGGARFADGVDSYTASFGLRLRW